MDFESLEVESISLTARTNGLTKLCQLTDEHKETVKNHQKLSKPIESLKMEVGREKKTLKTEKRV
jgi:hypothetical protein